MLFSNTREQIQRKVQQGNRLKTQHWETKLLKLNAASSEKVRIEDWSEIEDLESFFFYLGTNVRKSGGTLEEGINEG